MTQNFMSPNILRIIFNGITYFFTLLDYNRAFVGFLIILVIFKIWYSQKI